MEIELDRFKDNYMTVPEALEIMRQVNTGNELNMLHAMRLDSVPEAVNTLSKVDISDTDLYVDLLNLTTLEDTDNIQLIIKELRNLLIRGINTNTILKHLNNIPKFQNPKISQITKKQKDKELKCQENRENVLNYFLGKDSPIRDKQNYLEVNEIMRQFPNYVEFYNEDEQKVIIKDITKRFKIKTQRKKRYAGVLQLFKALDIKYMSVTRSNKKRKPVVILANGINESNYMDYYKNIKSDNPKSHDEILKEI